MCFCFDNVSTQRKIPMSPLLTVTCITLTSQRDGHTNKRRIRTRAKCRHDNRKYVKKYLTQPSIHTLTVFECSIRTQSVFLFCQCHALHYAAEDQEGQCGGWVKLWRDWLTGTQLSLSIFHSIGQPQSSSGQRCVKKVPSASAEWRSRDIPRRVARVLRYPCSVTRERYPPKTAYAHCCVFAVGSKVVIIVKVLKVILRWMVQICCATVIRREMRSYIGRGVFSEANWTHRSVAQRWS